MNARAFPGTPAADVPTLPDAPTSTVAAAVQSTDTKSTNTTTRDFPLWNKEVVPFARDLLFVIGIFGYLIGFANHTAKMAQFGMETQLADQPISSLFTWATEAIEGGRAGFAIIFAVVASLLLFAGFLKHRLAASAVSRSLVYAIVTGAVCSGLFLSFAWSSKVGVCDAARHWAGDKHLMTVRIRIGPQTTIPALATDGKTWPAAYVLAETSDAYQVLVNQAPPARPLPIVLPRSEVVSLEYATSLNNDLRTPVVLPNNRDPGPSVATPDPTLSGADSATDESAPGMPTLPECVAGMSG